MCSGRRPTYCGTLTVTELLTLLALTNTVFLRIDSASELGVSVGALLPAGVDSCPGWGVYGVIDPPWPCRMLTVTLMGLERVLNMALAALSCTTSGSGMSKSGGETSGKLAPIVYSPLIEALGQSMNRWRTGCSLSSFI